MNLRDVVLPSLMTIATIWMLSALWGPKQSTSHDESVKSGQSFQAVASQHMCQPINTEIDFESVSDEGEEHIVRHGFNTTWVLTNKGGAVERLAFERPANDITTLIPDSATRSREEKGFLVALDGESPYTFEVQDSHDARDTTGVVYEAKGSRADIIKQYDFDKNRYVMDLTLTVRPHSSEGVLPRLFVPGPWIEGLHKKNALSGIMFGASDSLEKIDPAKKTKTVWSSPRIFGLQNKYFVHALVEDADTFVKRTYFKVTQPDDAFAVLEGPRVREERTYHMRFYCGPKQEEALKAVDERLTQTLDFGLLAPLAKAILFLLRYIKAYTGSYGWAIIILTLCIRLALLPFVGNAQAEMGKKERERQAKMAHLKKKYKDDPEQLAREQMRLLKETGLPGGKGCIGMLLQFPLFLALNTALRTSIELYQAPFLWITDLSAPDPYKILAAIVGIFLFIMFAKKAKKPQHYVAVAVIASIVAGVVGNLSAGLLLFMVVSFGAAVVQNQFAQA